MTPSKYEKFKGLKSENSRDHMNDLDLIFTMLEERITTELSQQEEPESFKANKKVATRGISVAGKARKETEKELGRSVSTSENYLVESSKNKSISDKNK